jgi:ligand-binding sensor domain-containing protein
VQLFALNSFAQNYTAKIYDERLGLYQKFISEILKDDDGFLWLGTESGLVRFDGSNFNEFFPKESKYKYLGVRKIKKLNDFIYLNYEKNGLLVFDLNKYQYKKLVDEPIIDVQPISDSAFVVITKSGFLKNIINGKLDIYISLKN